MAEDNINDNINVSNEEQKEEKKKRIRRPKEIIEAEKQEKKQKREEQEKIKKIEKLKEYRRNYYKNKYNTDEEYRSKRKTLSLKNYVKKTKKCKTCSGRINIDSDVDICLNCKLNEFEQLKCDNGRSNKKNNKKITRKQEIINDLITILKNFIKDIPKDKKKLTIEMIESKARELYDIVRLNKAKPQCLKKNVIL